MISRLHIPLIILTMNSTTSKSIISPEQWRHLLRALLRECSYLPDPIARSCMHSHIIQRYRRYTDKPDPEQQNDVLWQSRIRRSALQRLSLLKRANEGYSRPLERVLHMSYGRTGKRRRELLATLITPEIAADTSAVEELIKEPVMFEDGWKPPSIVVDLLKSQLNNPLIKELDVRPLVKALQPQIPKENSWGRPLARCRQRNIRKGWYQVALESLLPPLPEADWNTLQGLLSGSLPWAPVKRRKKAVGAWSDSSSSSSDGGLDVRFLVEGPSKGDTFRAFANGRPHKITRRFMRRLWQRVSCLVPRMTWNDAAKRHDFRWDSPKRGQDLSLPVGNAPASDIFHGIDAQGKLIRSRPSSTTSVREKLVS